MIYTLGVSCLKTKDDIFPVEINVFLLSQIGQMQALKSFTCVKEYLWAMLAQVTLLHALSLCCMLLEYFLLSCCCLLYVRRPTLVLLFYLKCLLTSLG